MRAPYMVLLDSGGYRVYDVRSLRGVSVATTRRGARRLCREMNRRHAEQPVITSAVLADLAYHAELVSMIAADDHPDLARLRDHAAAMRNLLTNPEYR